MCKIRSTNCKNRINIYGLKSVIAELAHAWGSCTSWYVPGVFVHTSFHFARSFIILCDFVPIIPCAAQVLPHRQMSDTVTFHCFPACCVAQWSVTRFLTSAGAISQASSLPLIPAHNSLCGQASQWGAAAGLSHSCSGFDLLPLTSDLSHCGRLPVRGAERDITAKKRRRKKKKFENFSSFLKLKRFPAGYWHGQLLCAVACDVRHWCSHLGSSLTVPCMCFCVIRFRCFKMTHELPFLSSSGWWQPLSRPLLREQKGTFFMITSMLRENIL